jgi:intraflagellar transport protein 46
MHVSLAFVAHREVAQIPRPDGVDDMLGLRVLDEPAAVQTDPTVLELQLRAISKKSGLEPTKVRSVEHAEKNPKEIDKWIASINELHKTKPPQQVHYTTTMPDVEQLMQEWPPEVEDMLRTVKLPGADIELELKDYARLVCSLLDIPVQGSLTQSLHLLFSLYSEFKTNQHFGAGGRGPDVVGMPVSGVAAAAAAAAAAGGRSGSPPY